MKLLPVLLFFLLPATVSAQPYFVTNYDTYYYSTDNGTITILAYQGPGGALTIPSAWIGMPIVSIGVNAFDDINGLTSVTILTSIGVRAFYSCYSLTSVTIPNSVTSIGDQAFYVCSGLSNVTIGNSVTSIGSQVFDSCTSLTAITVDINNPDYSSVAGVLFNNGLTTLVEYPGGMAGSYTISNSVTSIGTNAFSDCTGLTSIAIPDSVTNIGNSAFAGCTGLTNIT